MEILYYELPSTFEAVDKAVKKSSKTLSAIDYLKLDDSTIFKIDFMLREMLNNAVEHGNHFDKDKIVSLRISFFDQFLIFDISDQGEGIDFCEDFFSERCQITKADRNRGFATIQKLNFHVLIKDNTVSISLDLSALNKGESNAEK